MGKFGEKQGNGQERKKWKRKKKREKLENIQKKAEKGVPISLRSYLSPFPISSPLKSSLSQSVFLGFLNLTNKNIFFFCSMERDLLGYELCQSLVLDLIETPIQACGAPSQHRVLAVCSANTGYLYLSINLCSTE